MPVNNTEPVTSACFYAPLATGQGQSCHNSWGCNQYFVFTQLSELSVSASGQLQRTPWQARALGLLGGPGLTRHVVVTTAL